MREAHPKRAAVAAQGLLLNRTAKRPMPRKEEPRKWANGTKMAQRCRRYAAEIRNLVVAIFV